MATLGIKRSVVGLSRQLFARLSRDLISASPRRPVAASPRRPIAATLFLFAYCLMPFTGAAAQTGDFLGRRVTSVDVVLEGSPNANVTEMRSLLDVTVGQDYSPVRIHDSVVRLYRSGLISAARVEATADAANGVALHFVVRPQARIEAVTFEGSPNFPAGELRARLNQLDVGERLSPGAVQRGLADLLALYSSRGYYKARITPEVRLDPSGTHATVVYTITPGEQAKLAKYTPDIQGAKIDLSKVQHALVEGKPFTQSAVQDEMDRLRDAYLKQDYLGVRITQSTTTDADNNTVAVTITVVTGPKTEIEVQGLSISDKDKRKTLPFYRQGGVDDFTLEDGARRLQDYAQRKGYFFAHVTRPQAPDLSQPAAKLVYQVDPGRRYKLKQIQINGVDALSNQALKDEFKSKTASLPLIGNPRGLTSDDMLRQDTNLIQKRLREVGYRRAHVEVRRAVSLSGNDLIIRFDVEQGPRTYIEAIGLRGNSVLTDEQLRGAMTISPGTPLLAAGVTTNTEKLADTYSTLGYATMEVLPETVELGSVEGQDRVRLIFAINEGNRARIRTVTTRGTAHTNTARLERDFYLFKKGDWLRTERLQETERQIYETNAFNSVNISSEVVGRTANRVEERDVTVNLLEAKRRDAIFGFGFQTNNANLTVPGLSFLHGIRGLSQLTYYNLLGKLYTGSIQFRVSESELFGQVSFQNPRPFGAEFPTLVTIFARRQAEQTFRSDRYTASIQAERRFSPNLITYMTYTFERINITLTRDLTVEEIARNSQPIRLGRIGPSFIYDTRNNKFDPTAGAQTLGSFTVAASLLGGNEQFVKFNVEHHRYSGLKRFHDTIYSVSARLGLATPFGGKDSLPISERFFAGGASDLRGFGFEEAGPFILVPERDNNGDIIFKSDGTPRMRISPLGGNAVVVINNELRFPLFGGLGGTVFSDTGNVFRRVRDLKPGNLTETLGFGVRVKTPVGPLRLDIGFLVWNKPPGYDGFHIHFTIGQTF